MAIHLGVLECDINDMNFGGLKALQSVEELESLAIVVAARDH